MKTLLIKPSIQFESRGNILPAITLGYLAAALENNSMEVIILDLPAIKNAQRKLIEVLHSEKPDVLGISCTTPEVSFAYEDANTAKNILPGIKVVLGGPHPSALPEETLEGNRNIDIVVIGEGERTIVSLVKALERKESLKEVDGIAFRSNGDIFRTKPRKAIDDLDSILFPSYHLLPMDKYIFRQKGWGDIKHCNIISSRGCPYRCTYCSHAVFGRKVRMRSAENILDEIEYLYNNIGVKSLVFVDDVFTLSEERVISICDGIIKKSFDIKWACWTSVNSITEKMLGYMKNAGCQRISYGIETADEGLLKNISKDITIAKVKDTFKLTKQAGIEILAYFMIGIPGESLDSIKKSRLLAKELNPDYISVTVLSPFPGSLIYDQHREKLPKEWIRYQAVPLKESQIISLSELSANQLKKELKKFYREFYLNPRFIISNIVKIKSVKDILFYIKKMSSVIREWF